MYRKVVRGVIIGIIVIAIGGVCSHAYHVNSALADIRAKYKYTELNRDDICDIRKMVRQLSIDMATVKVQLNNLNSVGRWRDRPDPPSGSSGPYDSPLAKRADNR